MSFFARVARQSIPRVPFARFPARAFSTPNTFKTIDHSGGEGNEQEFEGRIEDETIVVTINGEEIWVPNVTYSLEWVLPTPVEFHLFAESPIIKETTSDAEVQAH